MEDLIEKRSQTYLPSLVVLHYRAYYESMCAGFRDIAGMIRLIPSYWGFGILKILWGRWYCGIDFTPCLLHFFGGWCCQKGEVAFFFYSWEFGLAFSLMFLDLLIRVGFASVSLSVFFF